ncbi:hypothetical protein [Streptomyces sp. NBC_00503]|uniref:hypothetical protein n=1 Tax=Streptomyces sp. NBC_00503 TaxID=2903659 RepID=UPI002E81C410|nr:hypothetical protein [Streptomyces sp. NBC_00503]WUD79369.1 hypothetical protein OG490_01600 [Streptomyces sp. NBC_00503]
MSRMGAESESLRAASAPRPAAVMAGRGPVLGSGPVTAEAPKPSLCALHGHG